MHRNKYNLLHISKFKICINFPYFKEVLKDLEEINPEEFHPK